MAETKDKLATLSQVKRLVESQGGGASLELLWEGTANKLTSTNIGVDLTEYSLVVFETTENSSNYSAVYPVVCPNPRVGSSYYTSHISGRYMSIDIANVSTVVLSYSYIAYLRAVYGIKASGGGVAPEPEPEQSEIWYDGNQTRIFTKDGVNIFDYQKIEVVVDASPIKQATETFTQPFDDFMSSPEGYVMLAIGQSLFFETSATYIRKITAYK